MKKPPNNEIELKRKGIERKIQIHQFCHKLLFVSQFDFKLTIYWNIVGDEVP